jgi:hypothetical protein
MVACYPNEIVNCAFVIMGAHAEEHSPFSAQPQRSPLVGVDPLRPRGFSRQRPGRLVLTRSGTHGVTI